MRGKQSVAVLAAGASLALAVVAVPSASALGNPVVGDFLCQSQLTTGGVTGTAVGATQVMASTVTVVPETSDISAPASASVTLVTSGASTMPASPPVTLTGASLVSVQTWLDIYTTPTNSPSTIAGAPTTQQSGVVSSGLPALASPLTPSTVLPAVAVSVQLPAGTAGQRQWLRLKRITYLWSASSGSITGSTDCRLVGPIQNASSGGIVTAPLFGFTSPLSQQYPESATNVTVGTASFSAFGDRVTVTDVNGTAPGPPSSSCTVTNATGCATGQQVTATVIAGTLSQQANQAGTNPSSTAITMRKQSSASPGAYAGTPSVTVSTTDQVMEGALNPVTVTDVRGSSAGWSLTASLSGPFTEVGTGSIATNRAKLIAVGCTPVTGSATSTAGSGGVLGTAVTLCGVDPGVDDSEGQSGGGQYVVTGRVELDVPAFQKAGEYTSTLIITLT